MDGYTVEEAAEVLGIPQGRVWELIARGVLAGASEGGSSMRVFLRSATPTTPTVEEPRARAEDVGGDGGAHGDGGPFRELLTEFRNLTERYGQALLALGEARGEVAALRSRVELLEARMDMRLPMRSASPVAWEMPDQPIGALPDSPPAPEPDPDRQGAAEQRDEAEDAREPQASSEPEPEPEPQPEPEAEVALEPEPAAQRAFDAGMSLEPPPGLAPAPLQEPSPEVVEDQGDESASERRAEEELQGGRRKLSGSRVALAGLSEALARAEDPTLAALPGAREAANALAALQRQVDAAGEADEQEPTESARTQPAAEPALDEAPDLPGVGSMEVAAEPEPMAEAAPQPEPEREPEPQPMDFGGYQEDLTAYATPVELDDMEADPAAVVPVDEAAAAAPEPEAADAGARPPAEEPEPASPYTTDVVEPDWFADGDFTWLDVGVAEPQPAIEAEPPPVLEAEEEPPAGEPEPPDEETELAGEQRAPAPAADSEVERETEAPGEPVAEEHLVEDQEQPSAEAIQDPFASPPSDEGGDAPMQGGEQQAVAEAEQQPGSWHEPDLMPSLAEDEAASAEEEAASAEEEHLVEHQERPGADAIRDAFASPPSDELGHGMEGGEQGAPPEAEQQQPGGGDEREPTSAPAENEPIPGAERTASAEEEHLVEHQERPGADSIQDAFDEPDATHGAAEQPVWPPQDTQATPPARPSGFGLFRGQPEALRGAEPPARPQPPASGGEEALMWLGDEFDAAELEVAAPGWGRPGAAGPAGEAPSLPQLSDAEIEQLAADEGWDTTEIDAIRDLLGRPPGPAQASSAADPPPSAALPSPSAEERPEAAFWRPAATPIPPPFSSGPDDAEWIRRRRGPAATAYRRLRKLFQG